MQIDHHGIPSFRVRGKIFATVPDDHTIRVFVDEEQIRAAAATYPDACTLGYWAARLAGVVVDLKLIDRAVLRELLVDAWRKKAPASLLRAFDESPKPERRKRS